MEARDGIISDMIAAAVKAGNRAKELRNNGLTITIKQDGTHQTNADPEAEEIIKSELAKYGFSFFGEEGGNCSGDLENKWIVDPIDGTVNFERETDPSWAVSIALKEGDIITHAVTYMPDTNTIYWAEKGKGAFIQHINDSGVEAAPKKRLKFDVNSQPVNQMELTGSYLSIKHTGLRDIFVKAFKREVGTRTHMRDVGCSAVGLAHLSGGGRGAYVQLGVYEYDIAAAALIAEEAGAKVFMQPMKKGSDSYAIIAAHPRVFDALLDVYKNSTVQGQLAEATMTFPYDKGASIFE